MISLLASTASPPKPLKETTVVSPGGHAEKWNEEAQEKKGDEAVVDDQEDSKADATNEQPEPHGSTGQSAEPGSEGSEETTDQKERDDPDAES